MVPTRFDCTLVRLDVDGLAGPRMNIRVGRNLDFALAVDDGQVLKVAKPKAPPTRNFAPL